MLAYFFLFSSLVALAFLTYSLLNLKKLKIKIIQPRVIVEFSLFLIFTGIGLWLIYN